MFIRKALLFTASLAALVVANVEKIVFVAGDLGRKACTDLEVPSFVLGPDAPYSKAFWQGAFPDDIEKRGRKYSGYLGNLKRGQRYELRVVWPAISPSDFYFERYCIKDAALSGDTVDEGLRIFMQTTYFKPDGAKMDAPEMVPIELKLDPYTLNAIPESLLSTIGYIIPVLVLAAIATRPVARYVKGFAVEHTEASKKSQ